MRWTYTQLVAMIIFGCIMTGVAFTAGAPAMGVAFGTATALIFCCMFLAYLNGYRSSEITR